MASAVLVWTAHCMDRAQPSAHVSWKPRLPADTQPLYVAIADAIADDAESGRLRRGTRLPTHRALAKTLGVDVTTVLARVCRSASARARRRSRGTRHVRARGASTCAKRASRASLIDLTVNLPPEPSEACDDAMRRSLAELARSPRSLRAARVRAGRAEALRTARLVSPGAPRAACLRRSIACSCAAARSRR